MLLSYHLKNDFSKKVTLNWSIKLQTKNTKSTTPILYKTNIPNGNEKLPVIFNASCHSQVLTPMFACINKTPNVDAPIVLIVLL